MACEQRTERDEPHVVKGIGYNVGYELTGVVTQITEGSETCNIQIAHARPRLRGDASALAYVTLDTEYGQANHFEKLADSLGRVHNCQHLHFRGVRREDGTWGRQCEHCRIEQPEPDPV
ncbi:MAG: hypothetical protein ACYCW6_00260 [Candidatus Xenobia bacterium]